MRLLQPWSENIGKRVVKSPKLYIRDSGLLHAQLGIKSFQDLDTHPKLGASWEGFLLEQVVQQSKAEWDQCYFWATHSGAELDLMIIHGRQRSGVEFKRTDSPKVTKSMRIAIDDLHLKRLYIIHAGKENYPMDRNIIAVAANSLLKEIKPTGSSR